jgi:hypothetical protein
MVQLYTTMANNKKRQIQLRLCDSMENAEATKSRVLVLLRTMSAHEIKEQFDIDKNVKVYIRSTQENNSKWCVRLVSRTAEKKKVQVYLGTYDSMEIAEATKSRVFVLLRTMSVHEIKEQLANEKNAEKNDWYVYTKIDQSKFQVVIWGRRVEGKRKSFYVGVYETKLESEKVRVRVEDLLKSLDPRAAIAQIQMLEVRSRIRIRPDNLLLGEHDAQQESVLNLPYIHNLEILNDKTNADMQNMALDRVALFKAYYEGYRSNNRPPIFWVPPRNLENTMLVLLPNGIPTLSTNDRSPQSQKPKNGKTAIRMLFILEEAEKLLKSDTSMRQRCVFFLHLF